MPVESTIIPADRLVLTRCWGVVTVEEIVAHLGIVLADPKFNPDYDRLVDHTGTDTLFGDIPEWASIVRRQVFSETSFLAQVAARDSSLYEFLRLGNAYHEIVHKNQFAQIFDDEGCARQWLSEMRSKRETTAR